MARPGVADISEEPLFFKMGMYKAAIPRRLLYSNIHFWFEAIAGDRTRCGLTAYAVRLLSDLFRIEWRVKPGDSICMGQVLGEVESTKAVAELCTPMAGSLSSVNAAALADPSQVNLDPYRAWLLEFSGRPENALTPEEYVAFLGTEWERTEKALRDGD